jgi:hypothetical protein
MTTRRLLLSIAFLGAVATLCVGERRQHLSSRGQRIIVLPNGHEIPDLQHHCWELMGGVAHTPFL